jgi:hypothetical protein
MSKPKTAILRLGFGVAALYVLSYATLSSFGGYRLVESGKFRPITWMADADVFVWQPRFGMCYPFLSVTGEHTHRMDLTGRIYFPMVCLDQHFIHPSRPYMTVSADGKMTSHPFPKFALMHPIAQRAIRLSDAIAAKYQPKLDAANARNDQKAIRQIEDAKWAEICRQLGE